MLGGEAGPAPTAVFTTLTRNEYAYAVSRLEMTKFVSVLDRAAAQQESVQGSFSGCDVFVRKVFLISILYPLIVDPPVVVMPSALCQVILTICSVKIALGAWGSAPGTTG